MILRWLNTLGGRVILFLVASLLIAQAVSIFFLIDEHNRGREGDVARTLSRMMASTVEIAKGQPNLSVITQSAGGGTMGANTWISDEPVVGPEYRELRPEWPRIFGRTWEEMSSPDKRLVWFADVRPFWMRYRIFEPPQPNENGPGPRNGPPDAPPPQGVGLMPQGGQGDGPPPRRGPPGEGMLMAAGGPEGPGMGPRASDEGPPPRNEGFEVDDRPLPPRARMRPPPPARYGEATSLDPRSQAGSPPAAWRASVKLANGKWVNGEILQMAGLPPWINVMLEQSLITLAIMLVAILAVVGLATKRLMLLAAAADRVGRGETLEQIPESGTTEVRRLTQSFNTMSLRLRRFIEARTQMLGAISHDLRTPITGLRLRAELVEDEENRDRMLKIVDEIHHLTEATLALAKDDSFTEVTDKVDVSSLIESICDDLSDVGIDVSCDVKRGVQLNCRPYSLRRAIRNLAENGAKYGKRSRIRLNGESDNVKIVIDDDGPGIPEDQLERVLLPFVRLENSRSRETGGAGLGLAITRSIVLNHGGDLELKNRPEGGLRAIITLPTAA